MGDWSISIQGTGCHHGRDNPNDSDRMFQDFVESLIAAGHRIDYSSFTSRLGTEYPVDSSKEVFTIDDIMDDIMNGRTP